MGPSLYPRGQTTIETMEATRLTPPKKAKTVPSAGKVMASVFWDADGILLIDYLQKGQTIQNKSVLGSVENYVRQRRKCWFLAFFFLFSQSLSFPGSLKFVTVLVKYQFFIVRTRY